VYVSYSLSFIEGFKVTKTITVSHCGAPKEEERRKQEERTILVGRIASSEPVLYVLCAIVL